MAHQPHLERNYCVKEISGTPADAGSIGSRMEIPGLMRLRSPSQVPPEGVQPEATTEHEAQEVASQPKHAPIVPKIDAGLEAKIEAMRAQARMRAQQSIQANDVTETSPPTVGGAVNYSILDQVLSSHGFETMPDSEDEVMQEASAAEETSEDSSDDSSDSDDDSDDSDDSSNDRPLTAEERERMLIAADDNDGPVSSEVPRTKNEIAEEEEPVRTPDFEIDAAEDIEPLGTITTVVGNACVVTGRPTPETKVLDVGSLLVFEDRKNLGYIADTFGPVILPMFTVKFRSREDLQAADVRPGRMIYLVPRYAVYVFSDTLRVKGTDASNIHDEEQSETEFSDDEQEARYKSRKKQQRKADKQGGQVYREARPLNDLESIALAQGLTYDPAQQRVYTQSDQAQRNNHEGRQQQSRGRASNRGSRGTHRGRPETNNYGRGPDFGRQNPDQGSSPGASFQRTYYQPESAAISPSSTGAQGQQGREGPMQGPATPTLYQPLKRPT